MDERTQIIGESEMRDVPGGRRDADVRDLAWSRDGSAPPPTGSPGDALPVHEDALARTFRARSSSGAPYLLEVQRDVVDPARLPATWGPHAGNAAIETMWRRRAIAAAAHAESGEVPDLGYEEYAPLLVCRERGVVFRPPSPHSAGGELAECRDADTLLAARLPAWTTTTQRFLYDPRQGRGASAQFYSADPRPVRGALADVGTFERFAKDLGRIFDREAAGDASVSRLAESFPCIGCPEVPKCYSRPARGSTAAPPGPPLAPKRLAPISFLPFRAIAHREDVADFGEQCDILGGAPWAAFRARHVANWTLPGRRQSRERLETELVGRAEAARPLDALAEKLKLFEAVVQAVAGYHRTHGRPHLGLSPGAIVSHRLFVAPGEQYDVAIRGGLRAPALDDVMSPPPGPVIWLVPPEAVEPYAHPDVARAAEPRGTAPPDGPDVHQGGFRWARTAPVRISVGRVWTDEAAGTTEFELDVEGLAGVESKADLTDRVRIEISSPGWERSVLWCRRDTERHAPGPLALRAFPQRLDSGKLLDLRAATGKTALLGTATVYRTYGAYYDLHSLGMLLLRAMLDNASQSVQRIAADVVPTAASLCRAVHDHDGRTAWDDLVEVFAKLASTPPLDGFLSPKNVCFYPGERPSGEGRIPPEIWAEVLAIAAACLTRGGVGFADSLHADPDPARFARPVERLLTRVQELRLRIPAERRPSAPAHVATKPAEPAGADQRDARIRELEESLRSGAARIARLQSEVDALSMARARVERAPPPPPPAADEGLWSALTESLVEPGSSAAVPLSPDDPAAVLVRTLLAEGLETLGTLGDAVAELGGQEFASEQRNLQRMVRQALASAGRGDPDSAARIAECVETLRAMKTSLGSTIGLLVEAHGRSTKDGSRRLLLTLGVAFQKELELSSAQKIKVQDILQRMDAGLGELIARFYDPSFEEHLRRELMKRRAREGRRPR